MTTPYEQLVEIAQRIRDVLDRGPEEHLRAIPGVVHVSIGLKERVGAVTDEHCIRVYVREKRPAGQVGAGELIPPEMDGVPTDVNVAQNYSFTADAARYRPLVGGVQITNRIIDTDAALSGTNIQRGTLGCIATLTADKSPVLLSNWHVLSANGGRVGDRVYQPAPVSIPPTDLADLPLRPKDGDDAIGRIVKTVVNQSVDCGIARLDVSSCCRCCGLDFKNEINGLSVGGHPPTNGIVGQRAAVGGMNVIKVGMKTGRTTGQVVDPNLPSFTIPLAGTNYQFDGQIQIASTGGVSFGRTGDSGSAIVDQDGYIVGLFFAGNTAAPPNDRSVANHIDAVCTALGITINFATATHTAGARMSVPSALFVEPGVGEAAYREASGRLSAEPAGRWLLDVAEQHWVELATLVNRSRPVTVAWHRAHGPAFLALAMNELRAGGETLPSSVDGVELGAALERMRAVLAVHGSPALRADLATYGAALVELGRGCTSLTELLERLRAAGLGATPSPEGRPADVTVGGYRP
jgi:hypothetical protein